MLRRPEAFRSYSPGFILVGLPRFGFAPSSGAATFSSAMTTASGAAFLLRWPRPMLLASSERFAA